MHRSLGTILVVGGLAVAAVGVLVWSGALSWFGRLPGDIRSESENTRLFIPITSMVVVSIVLSVVLNLIGRWRG